jgi:hypothetical protein
LSNLLGTYEKEVGPGQQALTMALRGYNAGNPSRWNNPETASYAGKVAKYYDQLQSSQTAALVDPIGALAAAKATAVPPPGAVASNVRPPMGAPDTLEAAPPGVAQLAALSGQGTAPTPQVRLASALQPGLTDQEADARRAAGAQAENAMLLDPNLNPSAAGRVPAGAPQQVAQAAPQMAQAAPPQAGQAPLLPAGPTPPPGGPAILGPKQILDLINVAGQANNGLTTLPSLVSALETMMKEGKQFVQQPDGTIGIAGISGAPETAAVQEYNKALGGAVGKPGDLRQGAAATVPVIPGHAAPFDVRILQQNPHLSVGAQLEPVPPGAPPGTLPTVAQLPGAAPAIQSAATAEAAGKASFEPTTITIGDRKIPVTHEQFSQITRQLGLPEAAVAAGSAPGSPMASAPINAPMSDDDLIKGFIDGSLLRPPTQGGNPIGAPASSMPTAGSNAAPTAPVASGPLAGAILPTLKPNANIGEVYQTPQQAGTTEALKEEYEKTVLPAFNHAQDAMKALTAVESAMQNYRTGPTGQSRLVFNRALQDLAQFVGAAPDSELAKGIASGEIINKEGNTLGFALARTMGARESQQIVEQAIKTNPGLATSPEGNKQLIALMRQQLARDIDRRDFYDTWSAATGGYNGAATEFNRLHPVEQYVTKVLPYNVKTPDEAKALPPGSFFTIPSGQTRSVPIKAKNG